MKEMTRKEALEILIAQGYCNAGRELRCEDCPLHDEEDDERCHISESRMAEAVRIIEKEM